MNWLIDWLEDVLVADDSIEDRIRKYNRKHPQYRQRAKAAGRVYGSLTPDLNSDSYDDYYQRTFGRATTGGPAHAGLPGGAPSLDRNDFTSFDRGGSRLPPPMPFMGGGGGYDTAGLLETLQGAYNPNRYLMGMDELEDQAHAAVNAQYNPIIAELKHERGATRRRGMRNKRELGQMFGALSRSLRKEIPGIRRQYNRAEQGVENQYDQLTDDIQDTYKDIQRDQEQMMRRLNIQAAAGDVLPEQMTDRAYFTNRARMEGRNLEDALGIEKRGDIRYTRQGSQLARREGRTRQADLMTDLEEVMRAFGSKISENRAAKSQAYTAALGDLQRQMEETAYGRAQTDFDNYLKATSMQQSMNQDQFGNWLDMQKLQQSMMPDIEDQSDPFTSLRGIRGRLDDVYGLDPQQALQVYNFIANSPSINQAPEYGEPELPPSALANQVVQEARGRLSPALLKVLREVALEYLGQR